jgi:S-adenosylmethionine decarboxylase
MGETRNFSGRAWPRDVICKKLELAYDGWMKGLHLTADLSDCQCDRAWLTNAAQLGQACVSAVNAAGLQSVAQLFHTFPSSTEGAGGVTATVLLAESHLCIHTWPEKSAVTLDVYVCNYGSDHSDKARALMAALMQLFAPGKAAVNALERGLS